MFNTVMVTSHTPYFTKGFCEQLAPNRPLMINSFGAFAGFENNVVIKRYQSNVKRHTFM